MIGKTPSIFVSYAWEDDVKVWVRDFATRLRREGGVDVKFDGWDLAPGDPLPKFMETSVRESDFILVVCTPKYKTKSDARQGGVGYEGNIITGELLTKANHRKFIPVLRKGEWPASGPSFLEGNLYLDLRGNPYSEAAYEQLLRVLHRQSAIPPTIGPSPAFGGGNQAAGGPAPAIAGGPGYVHVSTAVPGNPGPPVQIGSTKRSNISSKGGPRFALVGGGVVFIAVLVAVSALLMLRPSTQAETPPSTRAEPPPSTRAETLGHPERGWIEAYGAAIDSGDVDRIIALHVLPATRFFGAQNFSETQLRKHFQDWFKGPGRTRRTGFDGCSLANIASNGSRALRCYTYVDPPFADNKSSRVASCLVFTKDGKLLSRTQIPEIPECPPR